MWGLLLVCDDDDDATGDDSGLHSPEEARQTLEPAFTTHLHNIGFMKYVCVCDCVLFVCTHIFGSVV